MGQRSSAGYLLVDAVIRWGLIGNQADLWGYITCKSASLWLWIPSSHWHLPSLHALSLGAAQWTPQNTREMVHQAMYWVWNCWEWRRMRQILILKIIFSYHWLSSQHKADTGMNRSILQHKLIYQRWTQMFFNKGSGENHHKIWTTPLLQSSLLPSPNTLAGTLLALEHYSPLNGLTALGHQPRADNVWDTN